MWAFKHQDRDCSCLPFLQHATPGIAGMFIHPFSEKDEFMFSGAFIVMAGILSLLESFGFISADVKWGVPLAIIFFGLHLIYEAFSARKGHVSDKENPSRT
ncbi:TPA: hypothetical protein J1045_002612 [Escherichia coli]|nr:hypothetical protein [Escherichia coli]HAZ3570551.1 hypothetical protein [Escherichia coli]HAZ3647683.1 hypothetical protein [Escherichia coli]HAZ3828875.1 hypothetical protein [Escherichia coli]